MTTTAKSELPWLPEVIQVADPYVPDPTFIGGLLGLDHFASSPTVDFIGRFTAPLSNGDTLVAGLVPAWGAGNPANGLRNLGLVRYNAAGQRMAWSSAGGYGFFTNQYVVYPNLATSNFQTLRDVKVANGWIYLLVDVQQPSQSGLGRQDVRIIQVRENGSSFTEIPAFGYAFGGEDINDFYAAQMAIIGSRLVVAATAIEPAGGGYLAVNRLLVLGTGLLTFDAAWGIPYGAANSPERFQFYYPPNNFCAAASSCIATASFTVGATGSATTDVYIAGSRLWQGENWDPYVLKISSETGALNTAFAGDGWSSAPFDETNSIGADYAAGLYVYQNEVWLAAQVDRGCHPGIGVAKLNGTSGQYNTSFGGGGQIVFGGVSFDDPDCSNFPDDHIPLAMTTTGGRLGIVGYNRWTDQASNEFVDPMLAVVNAASGEVLSFRRYPVKRSNGTRLGDGVLHGVTGGPQVTSPFTVAGVGRDLSAGNTVSYLVGRFIPVSGDRIFYSNMGGSP